LALCATAITCIHCIAIVTLLAEEYICEPVPAARTLRLDTLPSTYKTEVVRGALLGDRIAIIAGLSGGCIHVGIAARRHNTITATLNRLATIITKLESDIPLFEVSSNKAVATGSNGALIETSVGVVEVSIIAVLVPFESHLEITSDNPITA